MDILYLVTFVAGVLTVFFEITCRSYLRAWSTGARSSNANSKLQATDSTAQTSSSNGAVLVILELAFISRHGIASTMSAPKVARLIPQPAAGGPFEEMVHISSFAIIKKGNKLLLEKRLRPEYSAGKWVIPGALINYGEDPLAGVKRVVKEQLGTDTKKAELIDVESYGDKHWDICFVYRVEIPNVGTLSPDVEKTDYSELRSLPPELRDDHKEVIDTLKARKRV